MMDDDDSSTDMLTRVAEITQPMFFTSKLPRGVKGLVIYPGKLLNHVIYHMKGFIYFFTHLRLMTAPLHNARNASTLKQ